MHVQYDAIHSILETMDPWGSPRHAWRHLCQRI